MGLIEPDTNAESTNPPFSEKRIAARRSDSKPIVRLSRAVFRFGGYLDRQNAPPVIAKMWRAGLVVLLFPLLFFACVLVKTLKIFPFPDWIWGLVIGIWLVLLFANASWTEKRYAQFVGRVRKNNYEYCLHCGYSLHGLPSPHKCPECGVDYDLEDVRIAWKSYFAMKDHRTLE